MYVWSPRRISPDSRIADASDIASGYILVCTLQLQEAKCIEMYVALDVNLHAWIASSIEAGVRVAGRDKSVERLAESLTYVDRVLNPMWQLGVGS